MILHENRRPADYSREISCLICYFLKAAKFAIVVCCKLYVALYGLTLQVSEPNYSERKACANKIVPNQSAPRGNKEKGSPVAQW